MLQRYRKQLGRFDSTAHAPDQPVQNNETSWYAPATGVIIWDDWYDLKHAVKLIDKAAPLHVPIYESPVTKLHAGTHMEHLRVHRDAHIAIRGAKEDGKLILIRGAGLSMESPTSFCAATNLHQGLIIVDDEPIQLPDMLVDASGYKCIFYSDVIEAAVAKRKETIISFCVAMQRRCRCHPLWDFRLIGACAQYIW